MKHHPPGVFLPALAVAAALASGCEPSADTRQSGDPALALDLPTRQAIERIERGLLPPVPVEGEGGWTIEERMARLHVPAVSVAVIHDFEVVWSRAYGLADVDSGEPATTETLFQAGSISKPVAATGALRLVEQGRLDLDAPINEELRSWKLPDNELTAASPVTLRRLLSHTAGTTVHGFPGYAVFEDVPTLVQVLDGEPPANTAPVRVDIPPGSRVRYSGGGTTIAQLAMIDVSGRDFPGLLRELVLEPLGMSHSTYEQPLPPDKLRFAAAGYRATGAEVPGKRHTYPEMAAAGLWTTASDLARFAIGIQRAIRGDPGTILSQATAREMLTPVMESAGLGFFLETRDAATYFVHGGADEGFQAYLIAHRDAGYGAAVMANSDNGVRLAHEILRAVAREYGWDGYLPEAVRPVPLAAEAADVYTGSYLFGDDDLARVTRTDDQLAIRRLLGEPASRLVPLGGHDFLVEETAARLRFRLDESGRAATVEEVHGDGTSERHPRLADSPREPLPAELLDQGDTDLAMDALVAVDAEEGRVNALGYRLLGAGRVDQAVAVFELNTRRHPGSTNPWDSLADGYLAAGDTARAVQAYRRVLATAESDTAADPAFLERLTERARSQLERMQEKD